MWKTNLKLLEAAGDDGADAGGGAASGADDAAPAALAAGATGDGGQNDQGAASTDTDWIPEKYRVTKDDKTVDVEASAKKLAEAHGHLEKKLGSGDVAPATPDDYVVTPPEEFKDVFSKDDPLLKEFLADMHAVGASQKVVDAALAKYFAVIPEIAKGAPPAPPDEVLGALKKEWGAEYQSNINGAYSAAVAFAEKAGMSKADIDASGSIADHPQFMKIMAAVSKEMGEDKTINATGGGGSADIEALQSSEAYINPKHPDHEKVSKQIQKHFQDKYGNDAVN